MIGQTQPQKLPGALCTLKDSSRVESDPEAVVELIIVQHFATPAGIRSLSP